MKYRLLDDFEFEAATPLEACETLRGQLMVPEPTIEEWLKGSAFRAKQWSSAMLPTDNPEHHIEDMIAAGLLT